MSDTTFTAEVQAPLVPADVSFPSFQFLPLDVKAVTDGELSFLSGDGFKAALTLMAKSWHETPAASLPDDDRRLAAYCGFGRGPAALTDFAAVKEEAMSDFTLCSDGRYYSRTLAPKALEAWQSRNLQIERTAKARQARADNRAADATSATTSVTEPATTSATESKGDQIRGKEIRSEERKSEGRGASSGKVGAGVEGGVGGRTQRPTTIRRSGSVTEPIVLTHQTINAATANRWAGQFPKLPNIEAAIREADRSVMPGDGWMRTMLVRLADMNEQIGQNDELADVPF